LAELKPIIEAKRMEANEYMMSIPEGKILFMKVQNAPDLYPVIVVEKDGSKWIETMAENMPNGRVNGGQHRRGFKIPLRNYKNGVLYVAIGERGNNEVHGNCPHTSKNTTKLENKT